jgi:hypothetical protein
VAAVNRIAVPAMRVARRVRSGAIGMVPLVKIGWLGVPIS